MPDVYQIVTLDPEDIEDEVRNPKLSALRAQGYRVVATMPVEVRGRPRLAFILEPPERTERHLQRVERAAQLEHVGPDKDSWFWRLALGWVVFLGASMVLLAIVMIAYVIDASVLAG